MHSGAVFNNPYKRSYIHKWSHMTFFRIFGCLKTTAFHGNARPDNLILTQIHRILINLVTNSSPAIEGSGTIEVNMENVKFDGHHPVLVNDLHVGSYLNLTVRSSRKWKRERLSVGLSIA